MRAKADLEAIARRLRIDILKMIHVAGSGHPGGSLSTVELITALYFGELNYSVAQPDDPNRDRFIISKGHGVPTVYAALCEAGCLPQAELSSFRAIDSRLQGHPDRIKLPFVEAATGSLGQGLSVALGMALAERLSAANYRVYCLLGDGEMQAGQVWEAFMAAGQLRTSSLTAIVDYNKVQLDGHVRDIMCLEPLADKLAAFGWQVTEIDGHDFDAISQALVAAKKEIERPSVIVAHTVKGKGVSFMEDTHAWHGKAPGNEDLERAIAEIEASA